MKLIRLMPGAFLFHASFRMGLNFSVSYRTELCCRSLKSNCLIDPSAPAEAKVFLSLAKWMSYTSLSWAISWVNTVFFSMSQIVHVVSMELVPIRFGTSGFQSKDVKGAENSLSFFRFSFSSTSWLSLISQILSVSPDVARRSGRLLVWIRQIRYFVGNE